MTAGVEKGSEGDAVSSDESSQRFNVYVLEKKRRRRDEGVAICRSKVKVMLLPNRTQGWRKGTY